MSAAQTGHRLPEALPHGESVLWQGRPAWRSLAIRAFHLRAVAIYFGLILVWRAANGLYHGASVSRAASDALPLLLVALGAGVVLALLAWIYSKTTTYTLTNRRVFMQYGAALPMIVNIPFKIVGSAGAKVYGDGTADIALRLVGSGRLAYLHLWPHARPWRLSQPEPMLRSLPDGAKVADLLARALSAAAPPPIAAQVAVLNQHAAPGGEPISAVPPLTPIAA